jgi:hypothetical protein
MADRGTCEVWIEWVLSGWEGQHWASGCIGLSLVPSRHICVVGLDVGGIKLCVTSPPADNLVGTSGILFTSHIFLPLLHEDGDAGTAKVCKSVKKSLGLLVS